MFNIKDFIEEQSESASDWEIDLSPLLALMVTLIPVLLLQTSFVTLRMLDTSLPVLSDVKVEDKKEKDKIEFDLQIMASKDSDIKLNLLIDKKVKKTVTIKAKDKDFDYEKIGQELFSIKKEYPSELSAKFTPDDKVSYEKIIKVLDVVRKNKTGELIKYADQNGQNVETDLLFPDVMFGNIADI